MCIVILYPAKIWSFLNVWNRSVMSAAIHSGQKTQRELENEYINKLTVKFLCDLIEQKIREKNNKGIPYSRAEIEQNVAEVLCESLAVKPEEIKPEARIIKDLGVG